jgi:hypothetical protein
MQAPIEHPRSKTDRKTNGGKVVQANQRRLRQGGAVCWLRPSQY